MPTSFITSTERSRTFSAEYFACASMASWNWVPMLSTGLSAFIALCMTTEYSRQRNAFSSVSVMVTRFWPWKTTLPPVMPAGGLSSRAIANSMVDLPQPDSPTTPTNSPSSTSRSTPSTARTDPRGVAYSTRRSRTSSMRALGTDPPHRSQGRVADLVEGVVQQRERRAEQGHAQARRERPQRHAGLQRLLALRPVQHRAPAQRVRIAEAEELQAGGGQHGVQRGAEEGGHDQRRHRRQQLEDDDVEAPLPAYPRGLQELPVAQGQRLGAHLVGAVGPAGDDQHDEDDGQAALAGVGGQDDDQRERRQHQEHVGEQAQRVVGEAAEVRRGDADEHRQDRRDPAGDERDHERLAGAVDELRVDVLAEHSGAEPVRAGRLLAGGERQVVGVPDRGEQLRRDRDRGEEQEDDQ